MKQLTINIYNEVGRFASSAEDGERVFRRINKALQNDVVVTLDFQNVEIVTASFLNTAVGHLYSKDYPIDFLSHIKYINIDDVDLKLVNRVLERAKEYFKK